MEKIKKLEIRNQNIINQNEVNIKDVRKNYLILEENLENEISKLKKEDFKLNDTVCELEDKIKNAEIK